MDNGAKIDFRGKCHIEKYGFNRSYNLIILHKVILIFSIYLLIMCITCHNLSLDHYL